MKTIRFGIVGTGNIAHRFAQACKNTPGAALCAVASRNIETAKAFAAEFDIPAAFGSYEAMAASDTIDAAYIAVPHGLHAECSILMMNAGKAVISEKPITVNCAEFDKMVACAKKNGVLLMEAMWARLVPGTIKLTELVKSGVLGEIKGIQGSFCYDMRDEPEHHAFKPEYGGGSLLDVGCYGLSFASWYAPAPVSEIRALAEKGKTSVDEHCCVLIKYENGAIASLSSGMTVRKPNEGYIFGQNGYVHVNHFYAPERLEIHIDGKEPEIIEAPYYGNGFEEQIAEFSRCLREGLAESPLIPHSQSRYILGQMDYIRSLTGIEYPQDFH